MAELVSLRCPACGAPIHPGDTVCEYCGSALYVGQASEVALPAIAEAQKVAGRMRERIAANAYDGDAYYQLGLACFTLQLFDQAASAFRQAQRLVPGGALPHYFLALAMLHSAAREILSLGEYRLREIQSELLTAEQLDPNLAEAQSYLWLLKGLRARNEGDYEAAIEPLCQAVALLPRLALGWRALAACYFQIGRYREAIRAAGQAVRQEPGDEGSLYLAGAAHSRLGEEDSAGEYARRVAKLRGDADEWLRVVKEYHGEFE